MENSKQYAEKIVEVAYYKFPLVPPKETVIRGTTALIEEYTNQFVLQKQTEIDELTKEMKTALSVIKEVNPEFQQLWDKNINRMEFLIQKHTKK